MEQIPCEMNHLLICVEKLILQLKNILLDISGCIVSIIWLYFDISKIYKKEIISLVKKNDFHWKRFRLYNKTSNWKWTYEKSFTLWSRQM